MYVFAFYSPLSILLGQGLIVKPQSAKAGRILATC